MNKRDNHEYCQIHRFHGELAIYLGSGQTVYLSEKQARCISKALLEGAQDLRKHKSFLKSQFSTKVFANGQIEDTGAKGAI